MCGWDGRAENTSSLFAWVTRVFNCHWRAWHLYVCHFMGSLWQVSFSLLCQSFVLGFGKHQQDRSAAPTDDFPCTCDSPWCMRIDWAAYQSPPAVLPWSKVRDLTCSSKQDVEECTAPALMLKGQQAVDKLPLRETLGLLVVFFPPNFELRPVR